MALDSLMPGIMFGAMAILGLYILINFLRTKAIIVNPDGTFKERTIKSGWSKFEDEGELYVVEPACNHKRFVLGILPLSRYIYFRGSSKPAGFHSGKAVYNPRDLKMPVGSSELRSIWREKRTADIGKVPKTFDWKILVYMAIAIGVVVIIAVVMSKFTGGVAAVPTPAKVV